MCGTGTYLDELDERTPALAQALAEANRKAAECGTTIVPDWVATTLRVCQDSPLSTEGLRSDNVEKENT